MISTSFCIILVEILVSTVGIRSSSVYGQLSFRTETQTVVVSFPALRNSSSDVWRPAIYATCFPGLHNNDSAPCRRLPNLIYAEELVYPDFRIHLPRFVNSEHKRIYIKLLHAHRHIWLRARVIDQHAHFLNQRGQNLLYANVTYAGKPAPGQWGNDACVSFGAHLHVGSFPPWDDAVAVAATAPTAVFAASPDDFSFQHFLDRVAILLMQTKHLSAPDTWRYIASTRRLQPAVAELWSLLVPGFNASTSLLTPRAAHDGLRLFLYPCQAPLIHPYHHQLASELIQQAAGFDPRVVEPIASRRTVLFLARKGSRQWDNEEECRLAVEGLLRERAQGEQLQVFDSEAYPTMRDVAALGRRVKLMVGVHGGAFYNLVFMQPGTGLVEICPVLTEPLNSRCGTVFWEMASVRNMHYWVVVARNVTPFWQIRHVDCGLVAKVVRDALENLGDMPSPLEAFHQGSSFG